MDPYQCHCGHHISQHGTGPRPCQIPDCGCLMFRDSLTVHREDDERKRRITTEHEATAWKAAAILRTLIEEECDLQPAWEFVLNLARGGYFNPRGEW